MRKYENIKIAVAGTGYVGLSIATLLSQYHEVMAVDIVKERVNKINQGIPTIKDEWIEKFFKEKKLLLKATLNGASAYKSADYVVVATPTNYDPITNYFDTHCIEDVIDVVMEKNPNAVIVIKSTIPIGYCDSLVEKYKGIKLLFFPEFLRESKALYDNLYPSRIIAGHNGLVEEAETFVRLLVQSSYCTSIPQLYMGYKEAEAVKLFANSYLALRVSYFNEIDTFCETKGINTSDIIKGIGYDPRIGNGYNNPSFGYGGYCLPKDTKQLLANYEGVPQNMISAIVSANETRKKFISNQVEKRLNNKDEMIGIYRLIMKSNSDNFRDAAINGIIKNLEEDGYKNIVIYEPTINEFSPYTLINDLEEFKKKCSVIIANRLDSCLEDIENKVYTRDIFHDN